MGAGGRDRERIAAEPADVGGLERVAVELTTDRRAVEHEHVHPEAREPHPLAVDHRQHPLRFAQDPGLLGHLFHRDLGRRVADVGPPGRVQPDPRVGALDEEQLAAFVADDGADRDLGRHVAGHAFADALEPFLHEMIGLALERGVVLELDRGRLDVGRDVEHLLEALLLVEVLREPETGSCDRGQRLAPSSKIAGVHVAGCHAGQPIRPDLR